MENTQEEKQEPVFDQLEPDQNDEDQQQPETCYMIRVRPGEQFFSALARIQDLKSGELVMAHTDHGMEPVIIHSVAPPWPEEEGREKKASYVVARRASHDEHEKYDRLIEREKEAFGLCQKFIEKHQLAMKLTSVERFFNGGKIIFYFTAESRVDFRELVKDLVQEFRTRVEIRQIGVRHETKMLGGIGCCGRELCCSSYIKNFAPVSIKMAKEQGLPLNPSKISGICNRLLCCLTYEFKTYHSIRKHMPKVGKNIFVDGRACKVLKNHILAEQVTVVFLDDKENVQVLSRAEWEKATLVDPAKQRLEKPLKKKQKKQKGPVKGEKT